MNRQNLPDPRSGLIPKSDGLLCGGEKERMDQAAEACSFSMGEREILGQYLLLPEPGKGIADGAFGKEGFPDNILLGHRAVCFQDSVHQFCRRRQVPEFQYLYFITAVYSKDDHSWLTTLPICSQLLIFLTLPVIKYSILLISFLRTPFHRRQQACH